MIESSCVYLIQDGKWLFLERNRKKNDLNHGYWIGIGGKKEAGETIRECALREVKEETGLEVKDLQFQGRVYFRQDAYREVISVYTASLWTGSVQQDPEGTLGWIREEDVMKLHLWPGDRIFLERMLKKDVPFFYHMVYDAQGQLVEVKELPAEGEL